MKNNKENKEKAWHIFVEQENLSDLQQEQFSHYLVLLTEWNKKFNITTITSEPDIIAYHFQDSLRVGDAINMAEIQGIADVGSGGGFPGIPLKIKYPHVFVVLIENNHKKISFLQAVIDELGLTGIEVCPLDWRSFLRSTEYEIVDLFVARASLQPQELVRIFSPAWGYDKAQLVYFATETWEPDESMESIGGNILSSNISSADTLSKKTLPEASPDKPKKEKAAERFSIVREFPYKIKHKKRKLVFFAADANT